MVASPGMDGKEEGILVLGMVIPPLILWMVQKSLSQPLGWFFLNPINNGKIPIILGGCLGFCPSTVGNPYAYNCYIKPDYKVDDHP